MVEAQKVDGVILDAAWAEHLSSEGIADAADDIGGVGGNFDFLDVIVIGVDEEFQALELGCEMRELDGLKTVVFVVEESGEAIEIVDAKLVEVANDDPARAPTVRERIGITLGLIEGREEFAVGLFSGLIELDAAAFIFDENFGRGDEAVDGAGMSVDLDRNLKLNEARGPVDAESGEQVEPKGLGVRFFGAARAPNCDKIFDGIHSCIVKNWVRRVNS